MKNLKYILVSALLVFAVSAPLSAQDIGNAKGKVEKKANEVKQDSDKAKKDAEDRAEKVKKHGQEISDDAKGEVEEKYNAVKKQYKDKIAKAATDEEKKELEAEMMDELRSIKESANSKGGVVKGAPDTDGTVEEVKKEVAKTKEETTEKVKEKTEEVKMTKEYGMSKAKEAKDNLAKREANLKNKMELIDRAKARIRAATDRVDAAAQSGDVSDDVIAARRAKIAIAQEKLDKLEASVNAGRTAYDEQKATLSGMYKEDKGN